MAYRSDNEKPATTVTYEGIEVGYYASTNDWSFTLRGRTRTAPSLTAAKEAIDKPVAEKKIVFEPVAGYKKNNWSGEKFQPLTITSIIEDGAFCWVTNPGMKSYRSSGRSKESTENIYLNNAKNNVLITEWNELQAEVAALEKQQDAIMKQLKTVKDLAKEVSE